MRKIILLMLVSLSFSSMAYDKTITYKNMMGINVELNSELVENYIRSNINIVDNLKECNVNKINTINPTHGARGYFKIMGKNNKGKCIVERNYMNLSKYICAFNKRILSLIIKEIEGKLSSFHNLEIYTKLEGEIFNNKNICRHVSLKEKSKKMSKEELDDIKRKNPNISALIKSMKN